MSTAQLVPETWELDGDDAAKILRDARFDRLLVDSVKRFRVADGFSHARSLAYASLITVLPGIIATVGIAVSLGVDSFRDTVTDLIEDVAPGASGRILSDALQQGEAASRGNGAFPIAFGLIAMFISGVTAFGQIERGSNRIYGVEMDRPFAQKYGLALQMFALSLVVVVLAFFTLGLLGGAHLVGPTWFRLLTRVLVATLIIAVYFAIIFHRSPRRHQPNVSWLLVGSMITTVLWVVSTAGLALLWQFGDSFGRTYGSLAGIMAFALWCYLISIGLYLGIAFAAQLEAVRAGRASPQDTRKVTQGEPGVGVTSPGPIDLSSIGE